MGRLGFHAIQARGRAERQRKREGRANTRGVQAAELLTEPSAVGL
ncbi:hypothetical protein [Actinophytocola sp. NPDC049390]